MLFRSPSKQEAVIAMLQRPEGATVDEVASVMGWQRHTVRVKLTRFRGAGQAFNGGFSDAQDASALFT